jgi:Tol biopolymer transport system component
MLLVLVTAGMSHAEDCVTRFTGELAVKTGKPVTEVRKFSGKAGPATLKLYNGAGRCSWAKRVLGAWVSVNGDVVFHPFKVNPHVGYLKATVTLEEGCNVLKVCLRGKPGSRIRIKITQQVEACGPIRVSVASDGTQSNLGVGSSHRPSISADGRFVAFSSEASNLVPDDTNGQEDVFVHERMTGVTELVSVASNGVQGNGNSSGRSISSDGRFVAFSSQASNLVPADDNELEDVFVHDRMTGLTDRVSVASDGTESNTDTYGVSISADGRFVAFESAATWYEEESNLAPGTSQWGNVFVHDRQTGMTQLVSVDSDGTAFAYGSHSASISADGRFVAFQASTEGEAGGVYVYDRQTGVTELVSVAYDNEGPYWGEEARDPSISADGRFVAFASESRVLVPGAGDTNGKHDIFVRDRQTGVTQWVSVAPDGSQSDSSSGSPSISADGRWVAFSSLATSLVPGDTNVQDDIFVHDRQTGVTNRVSVASDGTEANRGSYYSSISGDGRLVAFISAASNLVPGDTNSADDVFVICNSPPQQEDDGGNVAGCGARLVSVGSDGSRSNDESSGPSISDCGRFVAFVSEASNLVPDDTNESADVFVYDRLRGATERVSVTSDGTQGDSGSGGPSISGDGRFVAFISEATNLASGDTNGVSDAFVRDRQTGVTERVSVASDGAQANDGSGESAISGDGRFVAFSSTASNLVPGDTNDHGDVFVHDRRTGMTERVSVASDGAQGNEGPWWYGSGEPAISGDGRFVAFSSTASDLVPGDTNENGDIFVHDRQTGVTERVSIASDGNQSNFWSDSPSMSGDGRFVTFTAQ